ncbi:hypothetical protein GIB67_018984 [Kingdonia uniflora]|uniref:Uncharacterized protein n=1 Tax=Kingdonia uniflora TaxID=39325 RepID=A0A7J7MGW6_9MAGN|nr:hypothetical protein GIB67_018984 [Kingdonia uniflora]
MNKCLINGLTLYVKSMILGSQKVYYPFKDCSAMLIDDGVEVVTMSECPYCRRLVCAQCKIPWHSRLGCDEFKRGIVNDDLLVFLFLHKLILDDQIISQKMASELLKFMGSEESSSVEKSKNFPVINHSTGSAIASILLGLIRSVLFDVNWVIIELNGFSTTNHGRIGIDQHCNDVEKAPEIMPKKNCTQGPKLW